jgi:hypothetical protein
MNRNRYQWPLNIGIIIDDHANSRNIWYVLQHDESSATHEWVFQCHLATAIKAPEVLCTDRHSSLISAARKVLPTTLHLFCLDHLTGNVTRNVRSALGASWSGFLSAFWNVYRSVSPSHFEEQWNQMLANFPPAREYLESELYPVRQQWAWAWVSRTFSAGVRTNGRCEVENKVNKLIGPSNQTANQLYTRLNERTAEQKEKELLQVQQVSSI